MYQKIRFLIWQSMDCVWCDYILMPGKYRKCGFKCHLFDLSGVYNVKGGIEVIMNKKVSDEEVEQTIIEYSDLLYKICFLILKDDSDVQDVLQETFIKYMTKSPDFESEDHKKAWLIKVSQNKCKEFLRFHKRHAAVPLEEVEESFSVTDGMDTDTSNILSLIWNLKYKLKSVVILYYIEGYKVNEVARILGISESAVKKRLERARKELRIAKDVEGEIAYERI